MHALRPGPRRRRTPPAEPTSLAKIALFAAIIASLIGVVTILRPFLAPIVLALLLATVFGPVHRRLRDRFGRRRSLAALVTVAIVALLIVVPAGLFVTALAHEGVEAFERTRAWIQEGKFRAALDNPHVRQVLDGPAWERVRAAVEEEFSGGGGEGTTAGGRLIEWCTKLINYSSRNLLPLLSNVLVQVLNFGVMLFVMFYAFRDGGKMLAYARHFIPISASHGQLVLDRVKNIALAIVLGTFGTAAAQACAAFVAFLAVRLPGAFFWAVMLGLASMVPVAGTALVWVPTVAYLFLVGRTGAAAFVLVWSMVVVGLMDNLLKPYLMQGQSGMSTLVVFFAILGGIRLFGPMGIIYGPLIFGVSAVLLYIFRLEYVKTFEQLRRQ
ncbi:MAG: putative inner membrane protein [Lentisphaerae bacterium ADurb.BinA184]|nr:MAG: putative inner membrane protein [Lentisphaerae bacterium ADurb.BinA184]